MAMQINCLYECLRKRKEQDEVTNKVPYYKLFSFADPLDYFLMTLGTITAVGSGICAPIFALLLGEMINTFGETLSREHIVTEVSKVSLKYVFLAVGSAVASFSHVSCWMVTGERQSARIRSLYLRAILSQDIAYFDKETSTGEIIERISGDTILIQDAIGEKVGNFIRFLGAFIGGLIIGLIKGWQLSLVLISSIPPLLLAASAMTTFMTKLASRAQTAYSIAAILVEQTLGSIRTVASFNGEKQAVAEYDRSLEKAYGSGVRQGLAAGLGHGIFMFVFFCSYALGMWFGAKMISDKAYTGGDVLNVTLAILTGSFSIGQASPCLTAFASGQAAAFKMFEIINRKADINPYNTNGLKLDDINGTIELKDVYFSYPARPQEEIFSGFSLLIPRGTTVALVGHSGSGKSTVISLIQRFYDPQAGDVLIDGINIKEFQLRWIRSKISLVSQEPVLFTSSIRENITYGKDNATMEEIKAAVKHANAARFIDKLPQECTALTGLETMVGGHGTQLSGGQKQRIAIARAILKDPRILLLDEATSALDVDSERIVQKTLDRIMLNRTTVIVAHRLSTVKEADTIAVIHHGKIGEKGSHSELLQDPNGAYSQLVKLQELSKKSSNQIEKDQGSSEIIVDSVRHSGEDISLLKSTSQCLPGTGSSSPCRFTISTVLATDVSAVETAVGESKKFAAVPAKACQNFPLHHLAYLNKPEIPQLLLGSFAAVISGIMLPLFGLVISKMLKVFFEPSHELEKKSKFWALMLVVLGVASLMAIPLKAYFFAVAGCKLIRRIRLMCFEKVVNMQISWFDRQENASGTISSRLSVDAISVRSLVGDSLSMLVQNCATAAAGLIIGFGANWQLSLIVLLMLPLIGLFGYLQMKFIGGFSADAKKLYEDASQVASDAIGSIRTVASFSAEEKVLQNYKKKCEDPTKAGITQGLYIGAGYGLATFLLYSVYGTIFYAGARLIEAGKINYAEIFQVYYGLNMTAFAISQSGFLDQDFSKGKASVASMFALLHQKSEIDSSNNTGIMLENVKGDLEFQHVSFRYPSRRDIHIFKDFCLAINSRKTVALVGESGSGKSTVISLLQRFYDPDHGKITLDGVEIQKMNLKWLRQQIGLVSQEPVLFNGTIRANIAYGKEGIATEAEIVSAAKIANAHTYISGLQQGYDTLVGERGIQLSGGQKQRVAIARAIVRSPKILLLDEATSALDSESEKAVQAALDQAMVDQTTVVVAHRLSTIRDADLIAVLKNGVIVEKGNHETLMNNKDGFYASLVATYAAVSSTDDLATQEKQK
ncbi:hypothetical protein M9H77_13987 [Catharanthus roseus]|uniref:Uncharacterized protein n=1 Tax=Catharanthus roseus TaxID=4058 RepID=A0ACC0BLX4_CATRO|nr:hypothetical protein M9H77_13987 [Catharanthus roseus]